MTSTFASCPGDSGSVSFLIEADLKNQIGFAGRSSQKLVPEKNVGRKGDLHDIDHIQCWNRIL